MANKTAVEWLVDEIEKIWKHDVDFDEIRKIIDQAKEMEKQQIMDAYNDAEDKCEYFIEEHAWQRYYHLSEDYYKQTFKSD
jgi:vacuolar-type H+-ATPase subunit H